MLNTREITQWKCFHRNLPGNKILMNILVPWESCWIVVQGTQVPIRSQNFRGVGVNTILLLTGTSQISSCWFWAACFLVKAEIYGAILLPLWGHTKWSPVGTTSISSWRRVMSVYMCVCVCVYNAEFCLGWLHARSVLYTGSWFQIPPETSCFPFLFFIPSFFFPPPSPPPPLFPFPSPFFTFFFPLSFFKIPPTPVYF